MERAVFHAALGALVPSFALFFILAQNMRRALPVECNDVLDKVVWLSPDAIYPHLECMGALGRTMYFEFYVFDLFAFPLIYAVALIGALKCALPSQRVLHVLPLVAAAADVTENCCMCFLLAKFPTRYEPLEQLISPLTRTKCLLVVGLTWLSILALLWKTLVKYKTHGGGHRKSH